MDDNKDTKGCDCGIWPFQFRGWMKHACHWHDMAYTSGSWQQRELSRETVDRYFLIQLLTMAGNNPLKIATAYAAYAVVRALGGFWWEGKR